MNTCALIDGELDRLLRNNDFVFHRVKSDFSYGTSNVLCLGAEEASQLELQA